MSIQQLLAQLRSGKEGDDSRVAARVAQLISQGRACRETVI